ncbi:MAG: hypothetical protein H6562_05775 [Lewinellaceae bacterium]|nr:hypothetical protein [Lewinellaceae bacterium]
MEKTTRIVSTNNWIDLFIVILLLAIPISSSCQAKHEMMFKLRKKKLEIIIFNPTKDTLFLPSQAYWRELPKESVHTRSDTLIVNLIREPVIAVSDGEGIVSQGVYFSDFIIPPSKNRIIAFRLKIKHRRRINFLTLVWNEGKDKVVSDENW